MSGILDHERFAADHRWARQRMSEYLDGALALAGRRRIEGHLGECADCRRLLAGLRRIVDGLGRLSASGAGCGADAVQIAASVRARVSELG